MTPTLETPTLETVARSLLDRLMTCEPNGLPLVVGPVAQRGWVQKLKTALGLDPLVELVGQEFEVRLSCHPDGSAKEFDFDMAKAAVEHLGATFTIRVGGFMVTTDGSEGADYWTGHLGEIVALYYVTGENGYAK